MLAILCGRTVGSITSQARAISGSKHPQSKAGAGQTVIDNAQRLSRQPLTGARHSPMRLAFQRRSAL
jgi:hypothetical protein